MRGSKPFLLLDFTLEETIVAVTRLSCAHTLDVKCVSFSRVGVPSSRPLAAPWVDSTLCDRRTGGEHGGEIG